MIRVLLAEDHETVREGIRLLLDAQPDMRVVAEAGDGSDTLVQAQALKPHVVVLDLTMPGMNGLSAAKTLHASLPSIAVIALTRHDDPAYVQELVAAGARGYVLKQSASTELLKAIRAAAAGIDYLDPAIRQAEQERDLRRRAGTPRITDREKEVLHRMA